MPDFQGTGETKCFYRLQTSGTLSSKELITRIAQPGSGLSQGTVLHVLQSLKDRFHRVQTDTSPSKSLAKFCRKCCSQESE